MALGLTITAAVLFIVGWAGLTCVAIIHKHDEPKRYK